MKLALEACKDKTRASAWKLIKLSIYIVVGLILCKIMETVIRFATLFSVVRQFIQESEEYGEWNYGYGSYSYGPYEPDIYDPYDPYNTTGTNNDMNYQTDAEGEAALIGALGFVSIVFMFCTGICCLCICCSPIFGCYYKFYSGIKKLDKLTGNGPHPRPMYMV